MVPPGIGDALALNEYGKFVVALPSVELSFRAEPRLPVRDAPLEPPARTTP